RVLAVTRRRDALLLGEAGQLVFVEAVYLAAVLPAVPVEPLGELLGELAWLVWILLRHSASWGYPDPSRQLLPAVSRRAAPGGSGRAPGRSSPHRGRSSCAPEAK